MVGRSVLLCRFPTKKKKHLAELFHVFSSAVARANNYELSGAVQGMLYVVGQDESWCCCTFV